jgi:hypothetical protein
MTILTNEQVQRRSEQLALGFALTDWGDLTYEQAISALEAAGNDSFAFPDPIVPWEAFEHWSPQSVANEIDGMRAAIYLAFSQEEA